MRTFLFLDATTTGLDPETDRITQLNLRLEDHNGHQDYNLNIQSPDGRGKQGTSIEQGLRTLKTFLEKADILVGHRIEFTVMMLIASATRAGFDEIVRMLTYPRFGFSLGRLAPVCTQRLMADYLHYLKEVPLPTDAPLLIIYHQLFGKEYSGGKAIACQSIYHYFRQFQLLNGVEFASDIICLRD